MSAEEKRTDFLHLGAAPWRHPAFVCAVHNRPVVVHRCRGKSWDQKHGFGKAPHLPGESRALAHFRSLNDPRRGRADMAPVLRPRRTVTVNLPTHFNAGLLEYKGRLLLASRTGAVNAKLHLSELDPLTFQPRWTRPLPVSHPQARDGTDDPRLFTFGGRLHCATAGVIRDGKVVRVSQLLARLSDEWEVEEVWQPEYDRRQTLEKNWSFFEWQERLCSVYSVAPHVVLHHHGPWTVEAGRTQWQPPWQGRYLRGGCPPVLVGDEYYHWFHTATVERLGGLKCYECGLYTFEAAPPFRVRRAVPGPVLVPTADKPPGLDYLVLFPCGAVRRGGEWLISYGHHDRETQIAVLGAAEVESLLRPVGATP